LIARWHYIPQAFQGVTVLAVSSDDSERRAIENLFTHTKWDLHCTDSLADARRQMEQESSPVILCSYRLVDGSWSELMENLSDAPGAPKVIVTTRSLDAKRFEELLHDGAFDVLTRPFQARQVYSAISEAWRQWKAGCEQRLAPNAYAAHP